MHNHKLNILYWMNSPHTLATEGAALHHLNSEVGKVPLLGPKQRDFRDAGLTLD